MYYTILLHMHKIHVYDKEYGHSLTTVLKTAKQHNI